VLARTTWPTVNQVSGPSPYTGDLVKSADQVVELVKPLVEQKKYLKNFFDKASRYVLLKQDIKRGLFISYPTALFWSSSRIR